MPEEMVGPDGYAVFEMTSHMQGILEELEIAHIYIDKLHSEIEDLKVRLDALEGK